MSTLQVANVFFDASGNNKIVYEANTITFSTNGVPAFSSGRINEIIEKIPTDFSDPIGGYKLSYNSTIPTDYIQVTDNVVNISSYPELGALLNIDPYKDKPAGEVWVNRTAANTTNMLGVTYGNGLFVSVGYRTAPGIQTSTDGITWNNTTSAVTDTRRQNGVAYGNGIYVAVGGNSTVSSIQSSTNGTTWTNRTTANSSPQNAVTYGNDVFVSVGASGSIQSSTNGTTWTNRTTANTNAMNGVTYGNGIFVAVGASGAIQSSTNGTTWTNRVRPFANNLNAIAYGNGVFVAVGFGGTVATSSDATTWTSRTTPITSGLAGVEYGNGVFVATGSRQAASASANIVITSTDGITWVSRSAANTTVQDIAGAGVAYGNGRFVICLNADSTTNTFETSDPTISYNTTTEFKTPPFNGNFSPYNNGYGQNTYIYMKT